MTMMMMIAPLLVHTLDELHVPRYRYWALGARLEWKFMWNLLGPFFHLSLVSMSLTVHVLQTLVVSPMLYHTHAAIHPSVDTPHLCGFVCGAASHMPRGVVCESGPNSH